MQCLVIFRPLATKSRSPRRLPRNLTTPRMCSCIALPNRLNNHLNTQKVWTTQVRLMSPVQRSGVRGNRYVLANCHTETPNLPTPQQSLGLMPFAVIRCRRTSATHVHIFSSRLVHSMDNAKRHQHNKDDLLSCTARPLRVTDSTPVASPTAKQKT